MKPALSESTGLMAQKSVRAEEDRELMIYVFERDRRGVCPRSSKTERAATLDASQLQDDRRTGQRMPLRNSSNLLDANDEANVHLATDSTVEPPTPSNEAITLGGHTR